MFEDNVYEIFDKLKEGIVIVNKKGVVTYLNAAAAKLDDVDMDIAKGRELLQLYPSLNAESSTLLKVLKTREPLVNFKQSYLNYCGEKIESLNSTYPLFKNNRLVGAIDISIRLDQLIEYNTDNASSNDKNSKTTKIKKGYDFIDIIGKNSSFLKAKERAVKAARTSSPVLIYGETGTGKELFVQAVHNNSSRAQGPFIAQNCAAIPEGLLEGLLFGTSKGSFTGAKDHKGLFEEAHGGTLYLDELNSMPLELQAKLLRVIQEGILRKLGDVEDRAVDVRIIATVNEEPEALVEKGLLRKDLFYRLNVVRIDIPPLRDRKEDIPVLLKHFLSEYNHSFHGEVQGFDEKAMEIILNWDWPGNIRELKHFVEGIFNERKSGLLGYGDIKNYFKGENIRGMLNLEKRLNRAEMQWIKEALILSRYNVSKAAELLELPRQTLQYKIKKYGL